MTKGNDQASLSVLIRDIAAMVHTEVTERNR